MEIISRVGEGVKGNFGLYPFDKKGDRVYNK
jgi:hypothetical protein